VRHLLHPTLTLAGLLLGVLTCASAIAQAHPAPPAPTSTTQPIDVPQLVDITASTHIQFEHLSSSDQKYIVESMSGGVALIDYDGDGYPDIYFTNAPSVAMALANKKARSALYHNNHDGTFTDVTKTSGLAIDKGWATGAVFGDYDADGNTDLFVPHYVDFNMNDLPQFGSQITCQYHHVPVQCGPRGLKGSPDALYRNNGDGTFTDVSKAAGVDDPSHFFGLGAVWSDFANDGKLDLFVANDGEPNYLYRNDGSGHFKDIALESGVAVSDEGVEQANMGIALGDYLNDGKMSIAISHFSEEYAVLYRNDGNLSFTDVSHQAGIAHPSVPYVGWGDAFVDLNNSGWQDLVLVNGHVYPQVEDAKAGIAYREPKLVYINQHNGTFREMSAATSKALLIPQVSRGLAVGDLFHRGVLDLVVENLVGGPMILETKANPSNHWVSFALEGSPTNRLALNARIRITTGTQQQLQEIRSGGSYLSQSDLHIHFGVGKARTLDKVEVLWPNGPTQTFTNVQPGHFYTLKQNGKLVLADPTR